MKNYVILIVIIFLIIGCNKKHKEDIVGLYEVDKVPWELSNKEIYYYLELQENDVYKLKKLNGASLKGHWYISSEEKDSIIIKFEFDNNYIVGKLKGSALLFKEPNVFDHNFSNWLYIKTNK